MTNEVIPCRSLEFMIQRLRYCAYMKTICMATLVQQGFPSTRLSEVQKLDRDVAMCAHCKLKSANIAHTYFMSRASAPWTAWFSLQASDAILSQLCRCCLAPIAGLVRRLLKGYRYHAESQATCSEMESGRWNAFAGCQFELSQFGS